MKTSDGTKANCSENKKKKEDEVTESYYITSTIFLDQMLIHAEIRDKILENDGKRQETRKNVYVYILKHKRTMFFVFYWFLMLLSEIKVT